MLNIDAYKISFFSNNFKFKRHIIKMISILILIFIAFVNAKIVGIIINFRIERFSIGKFIFLTPFLI